MKCEIIRDLLPTYADKIASEETVKEVEAHLQTCKECKEIYEEMVSENPDVPSAQEAKKEIKYMKKLNKKTLKIALLVFLAAVVIFGILFYACWWGMGVKKDDLEVCCYSYSHKDGHYNYNVEIRLKNGKGLIMHDGKEYPHESYTHELVPRKVLPWLIGGGGTETNKFGTGFSFIQDEITEQNENEKIIIKCSDGDIVLTPKLIRERAENNNR